ncbi:MAG: glutamate-5-semialdehyde dehydrogenase [Tannerellaceae bacterium]|jgi:glutamate-5-semialdehyde dehydrogenase|nr:glutamate-5-semialdehyde dehydrogenase [Tannerellaceae bacterium]
MNVELLKQTAIASRSISGLSDDKIQIVLQRTAGRLLEKQDFILAENAKDLALMKPSDPKYDRLKLTPERLQDIAADMKSVASLPSPLGKVLNRIERPNGMVITKITVPFGVIGIIYEARPNVTFDVFSLCLKSGNACVLKGGSDAEFSNKALVSLIHEGLETCAIPPAVCTLLPSNREATTALLHATGLVDLIIPRGSSSLINNVRANARIPVIETGAGICHTYFDKEGDESAAQSIVLNAKTRRVSVCNALDCLIIHNERLESLPVICNNDLQEKNVILYADESSYAILSAHYPPELLQHAFEEHYGTEFLDYKMSIKTVASLDEALGHIAKYGSKHSECIITQNLETILKFQQHVDAACVYANVSTAFTDGAQFGFGAEIGISTQKLHARGPMSLPELTTYKYLIEGTGQIRTS